MEKESKKVYEVGKKKRPEYHTLSLPQKINTVIFFLGCILPESLCTYMSILKHPHTQMASCYTCYSASVSWICFHTCKYRLTSSVNSSLVIMGQFLKTPLFFLVPKKRCFEHIPVVLPIQLPVFMLFRFC